MRACVCACVCVCASQKGNDVRLGDVISDLV